MESVCLYHASLGLATSSLCLTIPIYFESCELWWSRDAQAVHTGVLWVADNTTQFSASAVDYRLNYSVGNYFPYSLK